MEYELLCRPDGGADRPGLAAGPPALVRAAGHTGAILCAVPFAAGEPRAHQKEDGGAGPGGKPRRAGDPAAVVQRRRAGSLDDRPAAAAGLYGSQPELRLSVRHGDCKGQGGRDAPGSGSAGCVPDGSVCPGRRAGVGQDPAWRGKGGGIRGRSGGLRKAPHL